MKRTPWFPLTVKPVRAGVYEVKWGLDRAPFQRLWDGSRWCLHDGGVTLFGVGNCDTERWRGLTMEPKP